MTYLLYLILYIYILIIGRYMSNTRYVMYDVRLVFLLSIPFSVCTTVPGDSGLDACEGGGRYMPFSHTHVM